MQFVLDAETGSKIWKKMVLVSPCIYSLLASPVVQTLTKRREVILHGGSTVISETPEVITNCSFC